MSKIKEVLVEAMLPAIKAVGKAEMKAVLSGIKDHNTPEIYQTTLQGLYSNFTLLKQAADKTKTKVDDGVIDLILEAVEETAEAGSITLS
ncbi:MAG TPA: hypothetical protein VFU29_16615 [Chitinophagaceae bacterium]|nr:hypothetical protein [Chitinophagaceae bacterium]